MMNMSTAESSNKETKFSTRFGEVTYSDEAVIDFPNGLLGMPAQDKFFIAKMPVEKLKSFQVMQSLVDNETSFAIMPHELLDDGLAQEDIDDIKAVMEIKGDEMLIMLIASIQHTSSGARLSVNLRAPLFINTDTKEAYQIVLTNGSYQVQHFLN